MKMKMKRDALAMHVRITKWLVLVTLLGLITACTSPTAEPPTISNPMISDPTPQEPGKEVGISIDVSSAGGATLTYTWNADGGEIVRGQGSPAITYRVPQEPGTYNVRVKVEWDGQSTEKVTTIQVIQESGKSLPTSVPKPEATNTETPQIITSPTPMLTPQMDTPDNLIFQEDFEDGNAEDFRNWPSGSFYVAQDNTGNFVYEIANLAGSEYPSADFGSPSWKDYTVNFRVRFLEFNGTDAQATLYFRKAYRGGPGYHVEMVPALNRVRLAYWSDDTWQQILFENYQLKAEKWYSVHVEAKGDNIKFFIDNELIFHTIDRRLKNGELALMAGPGAYVQFDDIQVASFDK